VLVEQEPLLPRASTLRECLALRGRLEAIPDERDRWRTEARLVNTCIASAWTRQRCPTSHRAAEKKRAALALALALAPDLLLLDEPPIIWTSTASRSSKISSRKRLPPS
jgi:ATP-binding cassette subfamily F protein uup